MKWPILIHAAVLLLGISMSWFGFSLSRDVTLYHQKQGLTVVFVGLIVGGAWMAIKAFFHLAILLPIAAEPAARSFAFKIKELIWGKEKMRAARFSQNNYAIFLYGMATVISGCPPPSQATWKALAAYYQEVTNREISWRRLKNTIARLDAGPRDTAYHLASLVPDTEPHARRFAYAAAAPAVATGTGTQAALSYIANVLKLETDDRNAIEADVQFLIGNRANH